MTTNNNNNDNNNNNNNNNNNTWPYNTSFREESLLFVADSSI